MKENNPSLSDTYNKKWKTFKIFHYIFLRTP